LSRAWRWGALAVYATALVALAADPDPVAGGVANDKLLHAAAYAVFAGLAYWASEGREIPTIALAAAHGGGIELMQLAVEGRQASLADFAADLVGALLGLGLAAACRLWRRR